jgi:hypothetical protein
MEKMQSVVSLSNGLVSNPSVGEESRIVGRYHIECFDADGNVKWTEDFNNLVVNVGKNAMLDNYLAGSAWTTGTVYMGLKATGTASASDTMASHSGWTELSITSTRGTLSFSAASAGSKASSAAVSFAITAAGPTTVAGVFVVVGGTSAISNTTGTLFSAGDFATSRSVVSGDTLNVSYTVSV